jgi:hypothetical protein
MGGLTYLTLTKLKNLIKSVFRSPAKLITGIILIAMLVLVILSPKLDGEGIIGEKRDVSELCAIIEAFLILMFMLVVNSGFSTGASIYKLPDVNLVFTAPVETSRVLFYGLFQQMGTSLLMGFFIFFQYSWMNAAYGANALTLICVLVAYALTIFTAQLTAMLIYSVTSGSAKRRRIARIIYIAVPAAYALALALKAAFAADALSAAVKFAVGLPVRLFPVAGWLGGAAAGFLTGEVEWIILGLLVWIVVFAALIIYIVRSKHEFYEDVLQSTETTHATIERSREGRVLEMPSKKNVRVGKEGLSGGFGASAFYYKHLVENRRSRALVVSGASLVMALVSIGFGFIMRFTGEIAGVIAFAAYMQAFSVGLGRIVKELTLPYAFLVPEPPFKKLFWCIRESFYGFLFEAVLIFIPIGIFYGCDAPEIIALILMRLSFAYLFMAGNLISERIFGHIRTRTIILMLYILALIILCVPAVTLAIALSMAGVVIYSATLTACLAIVVCNVPIALLIMFLCRNIFEIAELHN